MKAARGILFGIGTLGILFGAFLALTTNKPLALVHLAFWLIGALILHDAVLAGIVILGNRVLYGVGRRLPVSALIVVQGGAAVGFIITLLAIPPIFGKLKGAQISTLPLPYFPNLLGVLVAISVITLAIAFWLVHREGLREPGTRSPLLLGPFPKWVRPEQEKLPSAMLLIPLAVIYRLIRRPHSKG